MTNSSCVRARNFQKEKLPNDELGVLQISKDEKSARGTRVPDPLVRDVEYLAGCGWHPHIAEKAGD